MSQFHHDNIFNPDIDNKKALALVSGVNFEKGELDIPFVEISNSVKGQFKHPRGSNSFLSYSDFLTVVDDYFDSTVYLKEDNEYEIKLHTYVESLTLRSKKKSKNTDN
ncbi:hypothetical protein GCM10011482_23560 [Enterococcus alcedinis]|uniref:Uncharacterized protein n=1 Tax=Enterococcus alcedinis TaxID=1274384 RepID=A0A917JIR0_9ENTE|nr:hypothetical protein [Enterococcus alcedinis]MBP2103156.1 hypothetical protein [Enterococcus alcedinis]GGI66702.1 hypothetical protein GCM10011482_23560 [Enterococcus alcedinis]